MINGSSLSRIIALVALMVACFPAAYGSDVVHGENSVLFIAGQSREEIQNYLDDICDNGQDCPNPGGASFYTSLDLQGFDFPHSNMPGDNHQDLWFLKSVLDPLVIQVGLWLSNEQLKQIHEGLLDGNIRLLAKKLSELNRPVLLRIGYEFDGPHNHYDPYYYKLAYRKIAEEMRRSSDIFLVWHSFAMLPTQQNRDVMEWYPGDDVVDWIGISFFQVGEVGYHARPNRERLIEIAREKEKPVVIAEASAIRYAAQHKDLTGREYWDYWYRPFFDLIEKTPEIKAVAIINVDWDSQKQHESLQWGDSRLNTDDYILEKWRSYANRKYWVTKDDSPYQFVREMTGR